MNVVDRYGNGGNMWQYKTDFLQFHRLFPDNLPKCRIRCHWAEMLRFIHIERI